LASSGVPALDKLLADGYPDKAVILISGPAGIGKEALRYWFIEAGLAIGDFCLYVTKSTPGEVMQDFKGYGVDTSKVPMWYSREGGQRKFDPNDLSSLSFTIKEILKGNNNRRIRIATDVLSSLLVLNPMETVYRFLSQLFSDIKQYDAVLLATLEEGMHEPRVVSTMSELFDGVVEFKLLEEGLRVNSLLKVSKMRGLPPQPGYFSFAFSRGNMEINAFVR
jgi:KaiC/GvpD/RAD55 family RecA-like ATPase